jgi:hypothetical protein
MTEDEAIGCGEYDKDNPELTRSCGDILFSNKIWLCKECYEKYKDDVQWRSLVTRC